MASQMRNAMFHRGATRFGGERDSLRNYGRWTSDNGAHFDLAHGDRCVHPRAAPCRIEQRPRASSSCHTILLTHTRRVSSRAPPPTATHRHPLRPTATHCHPLPPIATHCHSWAGVVASCRWQLRSGAPLPLDMEGCTGAARAADTRAVHEWSSARECCNRRRNAWSAEWHGCNRRRNGWYAEWHGACSS
jgi:hypothetical protein